MALGPPGRRNEPLNVIAMALALVTAAAVGASVGLLWHWAGFGADEAPTAQAGAS